MPYARFFAAVLAFCTFGAIWLGGPLLADEGEASAAARRTVKTTAGRSTRARRANDPTTSSRRNSDVTRDGAKAANAANAKAANELVPPAKSDGTAAPAATDAAVTLKDTASRPRDVVPEKGSAGRGRSADARSGAAKVPTEGSSSSKSTAERLPDPAATQGGDATPSSFDPASPSGRHELGATLPVAALAANGGRRAAEAAVVSAAPPTRSVVVMLEGPVFDGGDVPRAAAALERMKGAFARCATIENALTKNEASIDLRFLVRAPGRAEGVDVAKAHGVSADVVRCMTSVLARSYVGAPSDEPVGVAVTVRVRRPEAAND
jgi:hypothetical protein